MSTPAKPNETLPAPLNNLWRLMWMFWMQPILLNQKLVALSINPTLPTIKAWKLGGLQWAYAVMLTISNLSLFFVAKTALVLLNIPNLHIGLLILYICFIAGIIVSMYFNLIIGILISPAISLLLCLNESLSSETALTASDISFLTKNVIELFKSILIEVDYKTAAAIVVGTSIGTIKGAYYGLFADIILSQMYAFQNKDQLIEKKWVFIFCIGMAVVSSLVGAFIASPIAGIANAASYCLIFIITAFRIPIYIIELISSIALTIAQTINPIKNHICHTSIFYHELSHLPIPLLKIQILKDAHKNPELTLSAINACLRTPGQRKIGLTIINALEIQEIKKIIENNRFKDISNLQGRWLPEPEAAGPGTLLLRDVARQVLAADHASTPHHRLRYLNDAQALLDRLPNTLASETPERAEALAPVQAVFQRKLSERLASAQAEAANLLPNPFLTQPLNPEDGAELFLGRDALIRQLEAILADPAQRNSIALLGPRRCGKSSLLRMLPLKLPDAVPVFFDLQDNPSGSPAQFYAAIASRVAEQARRERQMDKLPKLPPAADLAAFAAWLEQLDAALGGRRLLLCIDEFERLEQLFPDDRRGLLQFMGLLRATVQHRRNIRLLVAGVAPFDELSADLWSDHFINLRELRVEHLDEATAVQLLTRPIPELTAITPKVARAVFQRTGGQPLLLQLYGSMLVDRLNAEQRTSTTADDLAAVDAQVLDGGNAANHFRNLYEVAPPEAKAVLLNMAQGRTPELSPATRRYLLRRCLITREGAPGIPVFLDWVRAEC